MMVPVPSGFRSGDQLLVETPDGHKTAIVIPNGAKAGTLFQAALPRRQKSTEMSPKHQRTAPESPTPAASETADTAEAGTAPADTNDVVVATESAAQSTNAPSAEAAPAPEASSELDTGARI